MSSELGLHVIRDGRSLLVLKNLSVSSFLKTFLIFHRISTGISQTNNDVMFICVNVTLSEIKEKVNNF